MFTKRWISVLVGFTVICIGMNVRAMPPASQISYQGYLEDGSGPVTATAVPMVFSLYETVSGGSPIWSEPQNVDVHNGLFNVLLGTINNPIRADHFIGPRYMGISVNGEDEMIPRQKMATVAYAFVAENATTANSAYSLSGPDGYPHNAVYVNNEGNVGVGTVNPVATLDIAGALKVGSSSVTCDSSTAGMIRYNAVDAVLEFCNGTEWRVIRPENRPPTQPVVEISPASPATSDDLLCTIITPSLDPDGDTVTYMYAWQKNGSDTVVSTTNTLSNTLTLGNETWRCTVTPNDGLELGNGTAGSDSITVQNTLPTQPEVEITPSAAFAYNDLVCAIITPSIDLDGDPVTYSYAWNENFVFQSGLTTNTVPSSRTLRGEIWQCVVTPNDGIGNGLPHFSPQRTIINSRPQVTSIQIVPSDPTYFDNLIVAFDWHDDDGDDVTIEVRWYKWIPYPGSIWSQQTEYDNLIILPSSATFHEQRWRVSVQLYDGIGYGNETRSAAVTISL